MARSPKKPPDSDDNRLAELDQYEAATAQRMKKARIAKEARDASAAAAAVAEISKPAQNRAYFSVDEIADGLARPPGRATVDLDEREHLCRLLLARADRGDLLDEAGSPGVYVLTEQEPYFHPYLPSPVGSDAVLVISTLDSAHTFLSRSAARRLLRDSGLSGAQRLTKEWFLSAKPKGPRLEKGYWGLARDKAFAYMRDEGSPMALGDKAKLQKLIVDYLGTLDEYPVKSTIQLHVNRWIVEFERDCKPQPVDR